MPFTQTDTHVQTSGAFQTLCSNEPLVNGLGWFMVGFEYPKAQSWIMNHSLQQLCYVAILQLKQLLVSCPAHILLWARTGLVNEAEFLIPKVVKTNDIVRSVVVTWHFPYNSKIYLYSSIRMFWTLLGDTVAKVTLAQEIRRFNWTL